MTQKLSRPRSSNMIMSQTSLILRRNVRSMNRQLHQTHRFLLSFPLSRSLRNDLLSRLMTVTAVEIQLKRGRPHKAFLPESPPSMLVFLKNRCEPNQRTKLPHLHEEQPHHNHFLQVVPEFRFPDQPPESLHLPHAQPEMRPRVYSTI